MSGGYLGRNVWTSLREVVIRIEQDKQRKIRKGRFALDGRGDESATDTDGVHHWSSYLGSDNPLALNPKTCPVPYRYLGIRADD